MNAPTTCPINVFDSCQHKHDPSAKCLSVSWSRLSFYNYTNQFISCMRSWFYGWVRLDQRMWARKMISSVFSAQCRIVLLETIVWKPNWFPIYDGFHIRVGWPIILKRRLFGGAPTLTLSKRQTRIKRNRLWNVEKHTSAIRFAFVWLKNEKFFTLSCALRRTRRAILNSDNSILDNNNNNKRKNSNENIHSIIQCVHLSGWLDAEKWI